MSMAAVASTSKRHREGETSGELSEGAGRAGGRGRKAKVLGGRTRMPGADRISRGREQRGRARGRGRVGRPPTGPESRTGGGRRPALGISCLDGVQSPCSCLWARCLAPRTQGHTGDGHADAGESGDAPGDTRTHAGDTASVKSCGRPGGKSDGRVVLGTDVAVNVDELAQAAEGRFPKSSAHGARVKADSQAPGFPAPESLIQDGVGLGRHLSKQLLLLLRLPSADRPPGGNVSRRAASSDGLQRRFGVPSPSASRGDSVVSRFRRNP